MSSLAEQLAQAEQRYTQAKAAVVAAEAKLAELKRAASSSNFQPLDTPANQEAFQAARARATEFQNGELAELQLAEGAAFRAERDLKQQVQQEQQKTAADTATRAAADQGPQTDSSGTIANQANQARDSGANTQNPPLPPAQQTPQGPIENTSNTTPSGNSEKFQSSIDSGTNSQTKSAQQSQATNAPITALPGPPPPNNTTAGSPSVSQSDGAGGGAGGGGSAGSSTLGGSAPSDDAAGYTYYGAIPGVAAPGDDNTPPNANATRQAVNDRFGGRIDVRPNVLDQYASYTYSISIYIMNSEDYAKLLAKERRIPANQLLIQSGGAAQSERDPNFKLDYYLDDVKVKSVMPGKGTRGSTNAVELEFRITEPNGVTLLPNLFRATQQYAARTSSGVSRGAQNYAAQNYLMVIRFYGYDDRGNLVPAQNTNSATTDPTAVVEKFIPFQFTSIKFRIANRLTEYECRGVTPQNVIGTGAGRGVIPYNVQLSAMSLKDLLYSSADIRAPEAPVPEGRAPVRVVDGRVVPIDVNTGGELGGAPPKANAAPKPQNLIKGLEDALNKFQREQVERGVYKIPDTYKFIIIDAPILNAMVRPPGQTDLRGVAQPEPQTAADAKVGAKQSVNNDSKSFMVSAGTSIPQFLDMAVRNSTYIFDQVSTIYDPKTNVPIPQGVPANAVSWFRIGVQAAPKVSDGYDDKRRDYAYTITYSINMYRVNALNSPYFPNGRFQGVHKRYDYVFTGANNAIISYEQVLDHLYYTTVNVDDQRPPPSITSNYLEQEKRIFSPNSPESSQYNPGKVGEPAANAADRLYSPSDQARVKMSIVGDPAWIQQGDVWSGVNGPGVRDPAAVNWLPDGTINFESQEALFEVSLQTAADFDFDTGLMDIRRPQ